MTVVVQKYGGSSVADVPKLQRVAEKVVATRAAGLDVVVVISAMGKTTDELLALAKSVDENPARRELDMLVTTGERISMALLSMAIQKRGCDAISFTGSQSGIMTNDRHFDARIIEVRPWRIEDELARGRIVIVAGYQGMSYRREITTLGRGGSDTTAIALAAALGAERAEIYSDVDGVYSADPRVVTDASHLPELTYEQMQEMAEAGAKVLNSTAVEFARRARIAIHARSTFAPGKETVVHDGGGSGGAAVVGRKDLARIALPPDGLVAALGQADASGLPVIHTSSDERGARIWVQRSGPEWAKAQETLRSSGKLEEGLGAVSVVAPDLGRQPGVMARALDALSRAGIAPLEVATAPLRWSALIEEAAVDDACRAVHAAVGAAAGTG
ncbi:MAG: aspartate kinase [Sandaracinaceae bacterium]